MTFSAKTSLALLMLIGSAFTQNCGPNSPCVDRTCCSKYGYCGTTIDHCGTGCQSNCQQATTTPAAGSCAVGWPCIDGSCCSQYGFCGTTVDYCGTGCLSNCQQATASTPAAGSCAGGRPCVDGSCCSQYGYCGTTAEYCGAGCQSNCQQATTTVTTTTTTTTTTPTTTTAATTTRAPTTTTRPTTTTAPTTTRAPTTTTTPTTTRAPTTTTRPTTTTAPTTTAAPTTTTTTTEMTTSTTMMTPTTTTAPATTTEPTTTTTASTTMTTSTTMTPPTTTTAPTTTTTASTTMTTSTTMTPPTTTTAPTTTTEPETTTTAPTTTTEPETTTTAPTTTAAPTTTTTTTEMTTSTTMMTPTTTTAPATTTEPTTTTTASTTMTTSTTMTPPTTTTAPTTTTEPETTTTAPTTTTEPETTTTAPTTTTEPETTTTAPITITVTTTTTSPTTTTTTATVTGGPGSCDIAMPCIDGSCCSRFGYCGNSIEHCGEGCQSNCSVPSNATFANTTCGVGLPCSNGLCCSVFGQCGNSIIHCGAGCISQCNATANPSWNLESSEVSYYGSCPYVNWWDLSAHNGILETNFPSQTLNSSSFTECFALCTSAGVDCIAVTFSAYSSYCSIYSKIDVRTMNGSSNETNVTISVGDEVGALHALLLAPLIVDGEWLLFYPGMFNLKNSSNDYFQLLETILVFSDSSQNGNDTNDMVVKCMHECWRLSASNETGTCWAANLDIRNGYCFLFGESGVNPMAPSIERDMANKRQVYLTFEPFQLAIFHRSLLPSEVKGNDQRWRFKRYDQVKLQAEAMLTTAVSSSVECLEMCLKQTGDISCQAVSHIPFKKTSDEGHCLLYGASAISASKESVAIPISTFTLQTPFFTKSSLAGLELFALKYGPMLFADVYSNSSVPCDNITCCLELAILSENATKFTYDSASSACYLLGDWAQLAIEGDLKQKLLLALSLKNVTLDDLRRKAFMIPPKILPDNVMTNATSYVLRLPNHWQYSAFMRMPGVVAATVNEIMYMASDNNTFNSTLITASFAELKLVQETSALSCLDMCLTLARKDCAAVSVRYLIDPDTGEKHIRCALFDVAGFSKTTVWVNTEAELFLRTKISLPSLELNEDNLSGGVKCASDLDMLYKSAADALQDNVLDDLISNLKGDVMSFEPNAAANFAGAAGVPGASNSGSNSNGRFLLRRKKRNIFGDAWDWAKGAVEDVGEAFVDGAKAVADVVVQGTDAIAKVAAPVVDFIGEGATLLNKIPGVSFLVPAVGVIANIKSVIDHVTASDVSYTPIPNWMAQLSDAARNLPITDLAIPGSHDSFTYDLDGSSSIAPDKSEMDWTNLPGVNFFLKPFILEIVHRWAVTQALDFGQQLDAGIRYFDLRIGYDDSSGELHFLHGLWGPEVYPQLDVLNSFLASNPTEVVILHNQKFFAMTPELHDQLVANMKNKLGSRIVASRQWNYEVNKLTLSALTSLKQQVIIFYGDDDTLSRSGNGDLFFPVSKIESKWPQTTDPDTLMNFLINENDKRQPKSAVTAQVLQGVLTPDGAYIGNHIGFVGGMEPLASTATQRFTSWIGETNFPPGKPNICMADHVEKFDFARTVININFAPDSRFKDLVGEGDNDPCLTDGSHCSGFIPLCGRKMIAYYSSWALTNMIRISQAKYLTHVIFAFAETHEDGSIAIGTADPNHETNSAAASALAMKRLLKLIQVKHQLPHLRTLIAVGGWENSQYFSSIAASPDKSDRFVSAAVNIMQQYEFDGFDFDWEYPVTGGATSGPAADKGNLVSLLSKLRASFAQLASSKGRSEQYLLTMTGAAGQWVLDSGFDLPNILDQVDWINVMTYDYFGAWDSKWGAYTGPVAPLYHGAPLGYSGKLNAHYTAKYYYCNGKKDLSKIVFGLPFYGRFWKNVGGRAPKSTSDLWQLATSVNGKFIGGFASYVDIQATYLRDPSFTYTFDDKTRTPYLWSPSTQTLMTYDNEQSIAEKVKYAAGRNMAGVMIWAADLDETQNTLLKAAVNADICGAGAAQGGDFQCFIKRWWTLEDSKDFAGMCGKSAPLFNGYYAVCDPDDPGYSCCSKSGYCGNGPEFCQCDGCVDYGSNPSLVNAEPIKPSRPVTWFTAANLTVVKPGEPHCGYYAHKFADNYYAICNPDDDNAYCCSKYGYCDIGDDFCKCDGCVDFRANPNYIYPPQ